MTSDYASLTVIIEVLRRIQFYPRIPSFVIPEASVVMQRPSYPTETVLLNKITRNRIVLSFKERPRKPLRRRPVISLERRLRSSSEQPRVEPCMNAVPRLAPSLYAGVYSGVFLSLRDSPSKNRTVQLSWKNPTCSCKVIYFCCITSLHNSLASIKTNTVETAYNVTGYKVKSLIK